MPFTRASVPRRSISYCCSPCEPRPRIPLSRSRTNSTACKTLQLMSSGFLSYLRNMHSLHRCRALQDNEDVATDIHQSCPHSCKSTWLVTDLVERFAWMQVVRVAQKSQLRHSLVRAVQGAPSRPAPPAARAPSTPVQKAPGTAWPRAAHPCVPDHTWTRSTPAAQCICQAFVS